MNIQFIVHIYMGEKSELKIMSDMNLKFNNTVRLNFNFEFRFFFYELAEENVFVMLLWWFEAGYCWGCTCVFCGTEVQSKFKLNVLTFAVRRVTVLSLFSLFKDDVAIELGMFPIVLSSHPYNLIIFGD